MSVEEQSVNEEVECSICGHVGGPYVGCETCGGNKTFTQPRAYTLSEERREGKSNDPKRYSRTGNVAPRIVSRPGSFTPDPNQ